MDAGLLNKIRSDYPLFSFRKGEKFLFRPPKTIVMGPDEPYASLLLLHELGHALCKHRDFKTDASRIRMEREAWEKARELAPLYEVSFDDEFVENEIDTYRDWLDHKSRCSRCGLTCYQTTDGVYHCPRCESIS